MKDILKKYWHMDVDFKKMLTTFVSLFAVGCVLLIIANMFPSNHIRQNIADSVGTFSAQGNYPYMGVQEVAYAVDNWTEAVLLDFYYTSDSAHPIYSAFVATEYRPENSTGIDRLIGVVQDKQWKESEKLIPRSSYWLGYSIILRPLLSFFDYQSCRMMLNVVSYAMLMFTVLLIGKKLGGYVAVGFGTIITIFHYYVLSLQYTLGIFCMFVAFAAIMYVLYAQKPIKYLHFMFVVGILTAYFEWFSIPLITFGLPTLIGLLVKDKEERGKFSDYFNLVFQSGIGWCLGYGIMLVSKNIVAMLVIGEEAWSYFAERFTADASLSVSCSDFVKAVLNLFHCVFPFNLVDSHTGQLLLIFVLMSFCAISVCLNKRNRNLNLVIAVLACAPMAWYIVFKGHMTHVGIEFRTLMISFFAGWLLLKNLCVIILEKIKNVVYKFK